MNLFPFWVLGSVGGTNYQANNRHSTAREELMRYTTPKPLLFVQLIFAMIDQPFCLLGCPAMPITSVWAVCQMN
jgi:hypothetical protein